MPHALAPYALAKFVMALYFTPPPLPYSLFSWLQPTDDTFVVCSLA